MPFSAIRSKACNLITVLTGLIDLILARSTFLLKKKAASGPYIQLSCFIHLFIYLFLVLLVFNKYTPTPGYKCMKSVSIWYSLQAILLYLLCSKKRPDRLYMLAHWLIFLIYILHLLTRWPINRCGLNTLYDIVLWLWSCTQQIL